MPVFVYVLLGIALLLILLFSSKVRLIINYDESLSVYAKFLFLKFNIISDEEKKPSRKKKKTAKAKSGKSKGEASKTPAKEKKADKPLMTKLFELKEIILTLINKFFKKLHFKFIKLRIVIASDNAAKTALMYGGVTQGVSYILELLRSVSTVEIDKSSDISVTTDFLSQKSEFEGTVELYVRVFPVLVIGLDTIKNYIKYKSKTEE